MRRELLYSQNLNMFYERWQGGGGGGGGGAERGHGPPPGFSHTLSQTFQNSKILPFLVGNTGFILIALPPEKFSADAYDIL